MYWFHLHLVLNKKDRTSPDDSPCVYLSGTVQLFKFVTYLAVPVSLTGWVVFKRDSFQEVVEAKKYVEYPESSTSFRDIEAELQRKRARK
jgi:hypothetical protein